MNTDYDTFLTLRVRVYLFDSFFVSFLILEDPWWDFLGILGPEGLGTPVYGVSNRNPRLVRGVETQSWDVGKGLQSWLSSMEHDELQTHNLTRIWMPTLNQPKPKSTSEIGHSSPYVHLIETLSLWKEQPIKNNSACWVWFGGCSQHWRDSCDVSLLAQKLLSAPNDCGSWAMFPGTRVWNFRVGPGWIELSFPVIFEICSSYRTMKYINSSKMVLDITGPALSRINEVVVMARTVSNKFLCQQSFLNAP